jgi:hypothetical protein
MKNRCRIRPPIRCNSSKKSGSDCSEPDLIRRAVYIRPCCHRGFILSRTLLLSNRQLWPHVLSSSAHFISTVTFSVQLHKLHSKVRTSGPSGPDTTPVSIIGPWHFGHGGRSISTGRRSTRDCGICYSPKESGESATLSVTDECRGLGR